MSAIKQSLLPAAGSATWFEAQKLITDVLTAARSLRSAWLGVALANWFKPGWMKEEFPSGRVLGWLAQARRIPLDARFRARFDAAAEVLTTVAKAGPVPFSSPELSNVMGIVTQAAQARLASDKLRRQAFLVLLYQKAQITQNDGLIREVLGVPIEWVNQHVGWGIKEGLVEIAGTPPYGGGDRILQLTIKGRDWVETELLPLDPGSLTDVPIEVIALGDRVAQHWQKARLRRAVEFDGAITAARSLVESAAKHLLDEVGVEYGSADELQSLYRRLIQHYDLLPEKFGKDSPMRQLTGGCMSMIQGLAGLRNSSGDAHGAGRDSSAPTAAEAALAVDVACAVTRFLIAMREHRCNLPSTQPSVE